VLRQRQAQRFDPVVEGHEITILKEAAPCAESDTRPLVYTIFSFEPQKGHFVEG